MAKTWDIEVEGVREIVGLLKAMPERTDKIVRKEFREIAKGVRDIARAKAEAARPQRRQGPKRTGDYHWSQLVNSIVSGAQGDSPTVSYGRDNLPGWAGWEFGSNRYTQFGKRTPKEGRGNRGYFFFPAAKQETEGITKRVGEIVQAALDKAFAEGKGI